MNKVDEKGFVRKATTTMNIELYCWEDGFNANKALHCKSNDMYRHFTGFTSNFLE